MYLAKLARIEQRFGRLHAPEYRVWKSMLRRCADPHNKYYGGRGVRVRFKNFCQFFAEVGPRPSSKHSIDRYPDNTGHYAPGNVRWATAKEQNNNTSRTNFRRKVERLGLRLSTVNARLRRGLSLKQALTLPLGARGLPSLVVLSERYEVPLPVIRERLRRGFSLDHALLLPSGGRRFYLSYTRTKEGRAFLKERRAFFRLSKTRRIILSAQKLIAEL